MASADPLLRSGLLDEAREDGYEAVAETSACAVLRHLELHSADLVVIDEPLADMTAGALVAALAARRCGALVISDATTDDVVTLIEQGADDVVRRPASRPELRARIHAILRRRSPHRRRLPDELTAGPILLHVRQACVTVRGVRLPVRPLDFAVLLALQARDGAPVSVGVLLDQCWPLGASRRPECVAPVIRRLRGIIEPDPADPQHLVTIRSRGYALRA